MGHSLLDNDTPNSPLMRPRSVPTGLLQSKDCIIAVKDASQLAQQLKEHAGKVSCVITAFGTCQALQADLGEAMYESTNKDRVRYSPRRCVVCSRICFCFCSKLQCQLTFDQFYDASHIVRQVCTVRVLLWRVWL